jgi:hypothetical protein
MRQAGRQRVQLLPAVTSKGREPGACRDDEALKLTMSLWMTWKRWWPWRKSAMVHGRNPTERGATSRSWLAKVNPEPERTGYSLKGCSQRERKAENRNGKSVATLFVLHQSPVGVKLGPLSFKPPCKCKHEDRRRKFQMFFSGEREKKS